MKEFLAFIGILLVLSVSGGMESIVKVPGFLRNEAEQIRMMK